MIEPLRPHPIIAHWMGCEVHSGESNLNAVRQVVRHYWPGGKFREMARNQRRFAIASAIMVQEDNRELYCNVMYRVSRRTGGRHYLFNHFTKDVEVKQAA